MRLPWPAAVAGVALAAVGAAGLIRGFVPQSIAGASGAPALAPPIVVTDAYILPPAPPTQLAAAYFTVYNTTAQPDTLLSVSTGAGATAVLHKIVDGVMTAIEGGVIIPPHGNMTLSPGTGHVMIGDLFGPLKPGQTVDLDLTFLYAGAVTVEAKVIALGAPIPTSGAPAVTSSATPPSTAASTTPSLSTSTTSPQASTSTSGARQ